jgi:hypothetical protein
LSSKLEAEVTKFQEAMDKLRNDTTIEIGCVSHGMESVCEKLGERLSGHIEETDKRIDRINQELKVRTKGLAVDLSQHVENTVRYNLLGRSGFKSKNRSARMFLTR